MACSVNVLYAPRLLPLYVVLVTDRRVVLFYRGSIYVSTGATAYLIETTLPSDRLTVKQQTTSVYYLV